MIPSQVFHAERDNYQTVTSGNPYTPAYVDPLWSN